MDPNLAIFQADLFLHSKNVFDVVLIKAELFFLTIYAIVNFQQKILCSWFFLPGAFLEKEASIY